MIRAAILERVRPLAEEFAGELAELLAQDFERRIGQLGEAFAVATSAFAAELTGDDDVRGAGSTSPVLAVPEAAVAAEQASTSSAPRAKATAVPERRAKDGRKITRPSCKKCGFVGGNKRGCGTAHQPSASKPTPAIAEPVTSSPPPIKPGRSDRFAAIEAAAARRDAAKRSRVERAAGFVRRGRGPTRGDGRAELPDAETEDRAVVALPEPVASFDL